MTSNLYVICTRYSIDRALKTAPSSLKAGEFLFTIEVHVPDSVFIKPPVPVVKVRLGDREMTTAEVRVDGQEQPQPVSAQAIKQIAVQKALSEMLLLAKSSSDPSVSNYIKNVLNDLMDAGVEVSVVSELAVNDDAEDTNG